MIDDIVELGASCANVSTISGAVLAALQSEAKEGSSLTSVSTISGTSKRVSPESCTCSGTLPGDLPSSMTAVPVVSAGDTGPDGGTGDPEVSVPESYFESRDIFIGSGSVASLSPKAAFLMAAAASAMSL